MMSSVVAFEVVKFSKNVNLIPRHSVSLFPLNIIEQSSDRKYNANVYCHDPIVLSICNMNVTGTALDINKHFNMTTAFVSEPIKIPFTILLNITDTESNEYQVIPLRIITPHVIPLSSSSSVNLESSGSRLVLGEIPFPFSSFNLNVIVKEFLSETGPGFNLKDKVRDHFNVNGQKEVKIRNDRLWIEDDKVLFEAQNSTLSKAIVFQIRDPENGMLSEDIPIEIGSTSIANVEKKSSKAIFIVSLIASAIVIGSTLITVVVLGNKSSANPVPDIPIQQPRYEINDKQMLPMPK